MISDIYRRHPSSLWRPLKKSFSFLTFGYIGICYYNYPTPHMKNRKSKIRWVSMGNTFAPLNTTLQNLASGQPEARINVTSTAQTITFDPNATTVEITPDNIPTAPIFIKWYNATTATQTPASATVFDEVISQTKGFFQDSIDYWVISFSIWSSQPQTVSMIERGS